MRRMVMGLGAQLTRGIERSVGGHLLARFEERVRDCDRVSRDTLHEILTHNAGTECGVEREFAQILQQADFERAYRERVPLSTWEEYVAAVERMAQGFQNVLCRDPPRNFALSSGTTGKPKLIPVTRAQFLEVTLHMACMVPVVAERELSTDGRSSTPASARDINLMSFAGTQKLTSAGIPMGSGSASGGKQMRHLMPFMWCSPSEVYSLQDQRDANYLHALFGLRERSVRSVQAVFAPHVLEWVRGIERYFAALVQDIADGTVSVALGLDPALSRVMAGTLRKDPARARELEAAARDGFEGIVPRLWPSLGYVGCCASGSFAQYHERLSYYTGKVPIFSPVYCASESVIGFNLWLHEPNRYVLSPASSYFEFIPIGSVGMAQPSTVTADELVEGESYEIVLTSRAGLYRYRLGDVVRCVGRYGTAPVLGFEYRRGTQLDLVGEKTTEAQTSMAVRALASEWAGTPVHDYTTALDLDSSPGRYVLYLELAGADQPMPADELERGARLLDEALIAANPRYGAYARAYQRVGAPKLVIVAHGGFAALERALAERSGNRNQVKIPRLLKDPKWVAILERHALARSEVRPVMRRSSLPAR